MPVVLHPSCQSESDMIMQLHGGSPDFAHHTVFSSCAFAITHVTALVYKSTRDFCQGASSYSGDLDQA